MKKHLEKFKEFSRSLTGKAVIFAAIIGLVAASFGPAWKAFANAPADTSTYAVLTINGHTALDNVNDGTSVTATYEHGSMTIGGTGLYSDGTNQVYVPNSTSATINIYADQDYTGEIWINGVNTQDTIANLNNVSSNDVFNVDAVFTADEGQGDTQATFDYTYAGTSIVEWTVNGSYMDVWGQQFDDNNHANFTGTYNIQPSDTTVAFEFTTLWIDIMDGLTINGTDYSYLLPVGSEQLAAAYNGSQMIAVQVPNVPIANTYTITTSTHAITEQEQFMGNFLWDNDTSKLDDPTIPEEAKDDIIGHGTLEFVKAEYNGTTYDSVEALNAAGNLFSFWNYNDEMSTDGGMTLPIGATVTLRLLPEAGYQLTSFGINGGQFEPQENVGEYTFEIRPGNGHLAAHFTEVEDEVNAEAEAIESGSIELSDGEIDSGTARLDVKDVDLTDEEIAEFENAAEGYNVSTFLDISLFQTTYKGSLTDAWDDQINELRHSATITLQLEEGVDGNEIVIVHQKHDGTYEVIPTVYDPVAHTITFSTSSFSNYAIASRTVANAGSPETGAFTGNASNGIAGVSILGGVIAAIIITGIALKLRKNEEEQ